MEQLLLVTSCDSPAGIGASLQTHGRKHGWTHRRDVANSILDIIKVIHGKGCIVPMRECSTLNECNVFSF